MPDLKQVVIQTFAERSKVPGNSQSATALSILAALSRQPLPSDPPAEYRQIVAALASLALLGLPSVAVCSQEVPALPRLIAVGLDADVTETLGLIVQMAEPEEWAAANAYAKAVEFRNTQA